MANWRALTIQSGTIKEIADADSLVTGAGITTAAGNLTIASAGGSVILSGSVGIGTTAPDRRLTVVHDTTGSGYGQVVSIYSNLGDESVGIGTESSGNAWIGTTTAHNFQLYSGGTPGLTLLSGGNVGIGNTSPGKVLDITPRAAADAVRVGRHGTGATNADYWGLQITNAGNTDAVALGQSSSTFTTGGFAGWIGNSQAFLYYPGEFRIGTGTGSNPVITCTSGGLVGIGTASPGDLLTISSNQNAATICSMTNSNAGAGNIVEYRAINDTGSFAYQGITGTGWSPAGALTANTAFWISLGGPALYGSQSAQPVVFCQSLSEIARFDTSGRLGIGTASPASPLDVRTGPVTMSGANGQQIQYQQVSELLTIAAAAHTDTAFQVPAHSVLLAVSVRVVTAIPTATTFTVFGAVTTGIQFSTTNVSTAAGSTDQGTASPNIYNVSAQSIRLVMNGGTPATATGQVRVTAYYWTVQAPTS